MPEPPECPQNCPNRVPEKRQQRIGLGVAAIALTLFVGSWVARGIIDRKTPTVFEVGFALACVYLGLADPKSAQQISIRALGAIAPGQRD
ncbi:MAG TPA: hypothetical protein V6C88_03545 [Chroococcidiopsis sp.]